MPIEFRCSGCNRLLRTPDDSAGKKARCPQCGTLLDVPASASTPAVEAPLPEPRGTDLQSLRENTEGSLLGAPATPPEVTANPFAETTGASPFSTDAAATANPYASPTAGDLTSFAADAKPRPGLPWEREPKSVATFWKTAKLILARPAEAFAKMDRGATLGNPLIFAICGSVCGGLCSALYRTLAQIVALSLAGGGGGLGPVPAGRILAQTPRGLLLAIFVGTVGTLLSIFIRGVIVHLLLLLVGGANARFETTMRVMSYVGGAVALLQVVPFVGLLVAWVATVFYEIIGLSAAHETTKGKSAVAVVLPVVACCLLAGLAVAALVTAAMH